MIKVGLHLACYSETDRMWSFLPPLGLGYLASYLLKYLDGVEVAIYRDLDQLIAGKPDIVGLTYVTYNATYAARVARRVQRELGCPVLAGGPHVSTLPSVLDPAFDLAVLAEGEETFAELIRLYQAEGSFAPGSLAKVQGILYRSDSGALVRTPARPIIKDLDAIPYPARELMFDQWKREPVEIQTMTSRGCPYDCLFCSTVQHWGTGFRYPSDRYVVDEVEMLRNTYDPKVLHFYDDLFVVRKDRVLRLLALLRERGLHRDIEYRCFVRSNLLDEQLMEAFAQTGFGILNIGFESGSDKVLQILNRGTASRAKNRLAVEMARRHGLKFSSCFIIGAPGETRESIVETFDFVSSSMDVLAHVQFSPLVILPGTQVWQWAKCIGVSDQNLRGIVHEPEDLHNGEEYFYRHTWPYLNEDNISREEFVTYFLIGKQVEQMISRNYQLELQGGAGRGGHGSAQGLGDRRSVA